MILYRLDREKLNEIDYGLFLLLNMVDFTENEFNTMIEAGALAVGLGPHRLRVETATIALLATVMLWSDSQQNSVF